MGLAQGGNLGQAQGSITINTSQAQQAVPAMQQVAAGIMNAFTGINTQANTAQQGISNMTRAVTGLAGAFGISFGAQGIVQFGKMAIDATEVATAFNRQRQGATSLAGSQKELNALLVEYQQDTMGAVSQAKALADTTKLLSLGFADNAKQLGEFATATRGIFLAGFGTSQGDTEEKLMQAVISQRKQSFRELGLEYDQIKQRAQELQAADTSLGSTMAFTQAAIEQANAKFGDLAKSAPSGLEQAAAAADNAKVSLGQMVGPITSILATGFAVWLTDQTANLDAMTHAAESAGEAIGHMLGLAGGTAAATPSWLTHATGSAMPANAGDITAVKLDWAKGITDLNNKTNEDILQQNSDYQRQRADSERQYQESTLRAAEDFGLQRQREEQDLADSISRIHRDSAQREERESEDLARNIAQAQSDSAERVANAKKDANQRLNDLDESYQRDREKAARHFHDSIIDAAGNLDAKAVADAQRNFEEQATDAKTAHDDQRDKIGKQLQERLDDEAKSLAKSITQQQDAYNRQLADGRAADAQRITDMQADFDKRKTQEDTDYGIRLTRAQQDHNDQLTEMGRAHDLRMQQIIDHTTKEIAQQDDQHKRALVALGVRDDAWITEENRADTAALKEHDRFLDAQRRSLLFPNLPSNTPPLPSLGGAYNVPSSYGGGGPATSFSRNTTTGNITFQIYAAPGQSAKDIADAVDAQLRTHLEDWGIN